MAVERIELATLDSVLRRGRLGLFIGPDATVGPHFMPDLLKAAAAALDVPVQPDLLRLGDSAGVGSSLADARVKAIAAAHVGQATPFPGLNAIASVPFSAVMSFCIDSYFDEAFRQACAATPLGKSATVLTELGVTPPPDVVPIFKLLGSSHDDTTVTTTTDYMLRKGHFAAVSGLYSDCVQGGATLCLGTASVAEQALELLAHAVAVPYKRPGPLILLQDDEFAEHRGLHALIARGGLRAIVVNATLGEVAKHLKNRKSAAVSARTERLSRSFVGDHAAFFRFCEVARLVNLQVESSAKKHEVARLSNILASPAVPKWDPFVHGLDLPRTVTGELEGVLDSFLQEQGGRRMAHVALTGGVATGKSTVLKRIALNYAGRDYCVVWLLSNHMQASLNAVRHVLKRAKDFAKEKESKGVLLVWDDPVGFGDTTPSDIEEIVEDLGLSATLLTGYRTSDWQNLEAQRDSKPVGSQVVVRLQDALDDDEWANIPALLVNLDICETVELATRKRDELRGRNVRDTLCAFFFLTPRAQQTIDSGVRDEYFRLGSAEYLAKRFVSAAQGATEACKLGLELVAVADKYRVPLPLEVLVHALGTTYNEWLEDTERKDVVWGVLYPMTDHILGTECYRTRNAVVTDIVVDGLNGGALNRAGEVRILRKLAKACNSSQSVFRGFAVRLMVKNPVFDSLDCDDGFWVYEDALQALPYRDKTLLHHQGNWVAGKSDDLVLAREILEEALNVPDAPYVERRERNEHIHTSLAALGPRELAAARRAASDIIGDTSFHLSQSRGPEFLNPHAVHVHANTVLKTLKQAKSREDVGEVDPILVAVPALDDIARTTMQLCDSSGKQMKGYANSLEMLSTVEGSILSELGATEEFLQARADQLYEKYGSQMMYIVAARKMFRTARNKGSGKYFNRVHAYCTELINRLQGNSVQPDRSLYEVAAQNFYEWRLRRTRETTELTRLTWEVLRELAGGASAGGEDVSNPGAAYMMSLASAHLDEWPVALRILDRIRQLRLQNHILYERRDFLYTKDGSPREVQGKISRDGEVLFACDDPKHEFRVQRSDVWRKENEIASAYLAFSFAKVQAELR